VYRRKEDSSMAFKLWSDDFKDGDTLPQAHVFNGMGHNGSNVSPHLAWSGAPAGTKSFVVTLYDPDAPTGSGWWHWIVANIPASISSLPRGVGSGQGALPRGAVHALTDFGTPQYGGAAPPPGAPHRYIFTVHALKVDHIDVDPHSSGAKVGFMTNMNRLGSASITAHYGGAR
jgi:Raf kinase inhibitor-like YbhB/YbcL family protein